MHRTLMGVVKIEHVRADAVDQRRAQRIRTLAPAQELRLWRAEKRLQRGHRVIDRFMMRGTDGTAQPVEQGARGFVHHVGRQVLRARRDEVPGQCLCHLHGVHLEWTGPF